MQWKAYNITLHKFLVSLINASLDNVSYESLSSAKMQWAYKQINMVK